jgi:hypothetical protein
MVATVVLDDEPRGRVVEVGPADEAAMRILEIGLDFRTREASLQKQPPKSSFHRRFSRLRKLIVPAETETQRRICQDQVFDWR